MNSVGTIRLRLHTYGERYDQAVSPRELSAVCDAPTANSKTEIDIVDRSPPVTEVECIGTYQSLTLIQLEVNSFSRDGDKLCASGESSGHKGDAASFSSVFFHYS